MIAVDTNILVYAHRADSEWHDRAALRLRELAEGRAPWAIPWPCIHEFLAIVTHPRIDNPAMIIVSAITSCNGPQEGFRRWRWRPFPRGPSRHRDVVQ